MDFFAEGGIPFFQRLALLTGSEAAAALARSRVIVVGTGGVGSWCAEALARSGVGSISLVDSDTVCATNINRQVQALSSTIGRLKTEALKERLLDINPSCRVDAFPEIFSKETASHFDLEKADYVIDAIDTLEYKLDLIEMALAAGKCFFSSMGMAQKLNPTRIRTVDIWETSGCPLARLVRQGLRKRNCGGHFTTVYSPEHLPSRSSVGEDGERALGSAVMVTAAAGMVLASLVVRDTCARFGGL
jgi:tRNA A37 threonylcarbamoyladenosine dehydratase